ncbi:MAG: PilN domain-containing protein [Syntrophales bacterium]|nr:PilN domain-containing protein [Syntrophales bacterium]
MIRINLLPYHETERKESRSRKIFILVGSMVLFLLILSSLQLYIWNSISSMKQDLKQKEERLVVLKKIIGEVDKYKREKQILEKKLGVIDELERNRSYPVRMLADIASQVPTKDVWLDKLSQTGVSLQIEGKARDNFAVVRFMKNLEGSMYIQSVELVSSKQNELSGIKLQQFNLSCALRRGM